MQPYLVVLMAALVALLTFGGLRWFRRKDLISRILIRCQPRGWFIVFIALLEVYWNTLLIGIVASDVAALGIFQLPLNRLPLPVLVPLAILAIPLAFWGIIANGMAVFTTPWLIYKISRKEYDLLVDAKQISGTQTLLTYQRLRGDEARYQALRELESETLPPVTWWFCYCPLFGVLVIAVVGLCQWSGYLTGGW